MNKVIALLETLPGAVIAYAGLVAPNGWLLCDGSLKNRTDYPALFGVIGTTYNTGSETGSEFRLPDLRGRVPAGVDNMGGAAASRLTTGSGVNGVTLGAAGGTDTQTLTQAQLPAHSHGISDPGHAHTLSDPGHTHGITDPGHTHTVSDPGHTHGHNAAINSGGSSTGGGAFPINPTGGATINAAVTGISIVGRVTGVTANAATSGITAAGASTGITGTQSVGTGAAHSIVQPTLVLNYLIRT